jgi:hypothetical protein
MSISENITEWIESFDDEFLDFILVSFDKELLDQIISLLLPNEKINKIIISSQLENDKEILKQFGKLINDEKVVFLNSHTRSGNFNYSLFFADFENDIALTPKKLNYYENIDRNPLYRKFVRGISMYRYTGMPPFNGYWLFDKSIGSIAGGESGGMGMGNSIFLKLSDWGDFCQNLSIPEVSGEKTVNIENVLISQKWLDSLKVFLEYFIQTILGTNEYNETLLNTDNMIVWIKGFIHETYNYIYNYQLLEMLGDKICSSKFTIYMATKYPRLTESQASEYHNQYMSKLHQWYISDDLNLSKFLLADMSVFTLTNKFKTDLFESLVGSLYQTCSTISIGLAEIATSNLFILIGEQFPFEKKMGYGGNKHRITQILESLGFPPGGSKTQNKEIDISHEELNKGKENAVSFWKFKYTETFKNFVDSEKRKGHDISDILTLSIEYDPYQSERDEKENVFWFEMDKIFTKAKIDILYAKTLKESFLDLLQKENSELYLRFKEKIRQTYGEDTDRIMERIHFKSNKESDNNYVIMYINLFIVEPESLLLKSLSAYRDSTETLQYDYLEDVTEQYQIVNLACEKITKERVGSLDTYKSASFRCIMKYINF